MTEAWWRDAACADGRGDVFYAERPSGRRDGAELFGQERAAAAVCARCEVRRECLTEAIEPRLRRQLAGALFLGGRPGARLAPETEGIWAGLLPDERRGKTLADVPALLAFAAKRAIREGLAPGGDGRSRAA